MVYGVPHHAVIRDYTQIGVSNDDQMLLKVGQDQPYAVKDYQCKSTLI
jgi:hypothetical protein